MLLLSYYNYTVGALKNQEGLIHFEKTFGGIGGEGIPTGKGLQIARKSLIINSVRGFSFFYDNLR